MGGVVKAVTRPVGEAIEGVGKAFRPVTRPVGEAIEGVGRVGGGLVGGLTGEKSDTMTITQKSEPWGPVQPYLKKSYAMAGQLMDRPMQYYPGQLVAGFTPYETLAHNLIAQRALTGAPETRAGRNLLTATLSGQYLNVGSNPYVQGLLNRAVSQADTAATRLGAYGSSDWQTLRARAASDLLGKLYEQERTRQMQALQLAPTYAGLDYRNLQALASVGAAQRALAQRMIDEERQRWMWQQMEPWRRLQLAQGIFSGYPVSTTQTQPIYHNPLAGMLSGGLIGAGIVGAADLAGGPYALPIIAGSALLGGLSA